jgi:hypothetical protein
MDPEIFTSDGQGKQGFTSPTACRIIAGYGYEGPLILKCPVGSYNPAGNAAACTRCPTGFTTDDDALKQASFADCYLAPRFGIYDNVARPCPVGEWVLLPVCSAIRGDDGIATSVGLRTKLLL